MATQKQQNENKPPMQNNTQSLRYLLLVSIGLALLGIVIALTLPALNNQQNWVTILSIALASLSAVFSLLQWLPPLSSVLSTRSSSASPAPKTPKTRPEEAIDPEQLQLERLKIGWSQERVASELGVDVKTYARWERGVQAPTAATAWMLNQLFRKESEEIEERLFEEEERLLRERMLALPSEPKERGKLTRDFSGSLFRVNEQLLEPNEFYGREQERSELLAAVAQEGSISIVGPANIGKTWLLTYFSLVAPARLGGKVSVGYVDAALPANNTVRGFVKEALKALDEEPFTEWNVNLEFFGKYVHRLQEDRLVVLCIDNFDKLAQREGFDRSFFEALRAMGQRDMSFVTASEKRLVDIVSTSTQSSHFFNIFKQIKLAPFTRAEAREFVEDKGMRAGFSRKEQEYLLEYAQDRRGQWLPLHLQLAGKLLLEDKRRGEEDLSLENSEYWQKFGKQLDKQYKQIMWT